MGIFKDVPKPTCWPPPKTTEGVIELLEYPQKRDPYGDIAHLILATLFLASIPINSVAASIGMGVLFFYWLVRLHVTWTSITPLLVNPIMVFFVLYIIWSAASLLWSTEVDNGLEHLRSMRVAIVPFLLWPIITRWKILLMGLLFGVVFLNASQFFDAYNMLTTSGAVSRTSGFIGGHPPSAGLWCGFSILISLMFAKNARLLSPAFFLFTITAFCAALGCILASGRGNIVGLIVIFSGLIFLQIIKEKKFKKALFCFLGVLVGVIVLLQIPAAGTFLQQRVQQANAGYSAFVKQDDPRTSTGVRLVWWSSATRAFKEHPILGLGLGGFEGWTPKDSGLNTYRERWPEWTEENIVEVSHPHSTYLSVLSEGGVLGSTMMSMAILCSSLLAWRCIRQSGWGITFAGLLLLWCSAGFFDAFLYHSQTLSAFVLAITLMLYFSIKKHP